MSVMLLSANHVATVAMGITKLLESFIYQCSEDINSRSPIMAALLPLLDEIKLFIFNRQDAYDVAPWTI